MIADLNSGGVLFPGLLVLAIAALIITIGLVRLMAVAGLLKMLAYRPLVELAVFVITYALLLQGFTSGPLS
ncbi:DUF1656 domain-containing protein [Brucella pseudogrignonensis]